MQVTPDAKALRSFSTVKGDFLPGDFAVATDNEVEAALQGAVSAFKDYSQTSATERATFLETIALEIMELGEELIERAHLESGLPLARLNGERDRTVGQLRLFAAVLKEGSYVEAVIDPGLPERKPLPRADIRRMNMPIGPVAVFGASNFPFAFSTAGGDTASALAAGCPVIVKAHPSHLGTNALMTKAIQTAVRKCNLPEGVFASLNGEGIALGQTLAKHPAIKAIGFTGSYAGGMALYRNATAERAVPIPVYAEMSSINPVLLLPGKLEADAEALAATLAGSITLGVGQFCTNPGLLFALKSNATTQFTGSLAAALAKVPGATMLNEGICKNYYTGRSKLSQHKGVTVLLEGEDAAAGFKGTPALMQVSATDFLAQPALLEEVFGPSSLLVVCEDAAQMEQALQALHGQLTGSVFGNAADIAAFAPQIHTLTEKVGRIIYNMVPTGVEVCHAMVHGGPFPATTDARTTSVGAEAIKRFLRPVCFQDCPTEMLPVALRNENTLGIMRKLNGEFTRENV